MLMYACVFLCAVCLCVWCLRSRHELPRAALPCAGASRGHCALGELRALCRLESAGSSRARRALPCGLKHGGLVCRVCMVTIFAITL